MKACPFCAEEIQDAAKVCKHCGRDLPAAAAAPGVPAKNHPAAVGCLVMIGLLALFGWLSSDIEDPAPAETHSPIAAYSVCQTFVTQRLRAPATAKFPAFRANDVTAIQQDIGGEYLVTGYVDAQNGFGALIRTRYTCAVQWTSGDSYRLIAVQLLDQ